MESWPSMFLTSDCLVSSRSAYKREEAEKKREGEEREGKRRKEKNREGKRRKEKVRKGKERRMAT